MRFLKLFVLLFFLFFPPLSFASSGYALPYPTYMPGNIFYKPHLVLEMVSRFWYFGDFGQFKYNLKEADKYLVESKTLFEYDQALLGYRSLKKSDEFFAKIYPFLESAKKNGKDISINRELLRQASLKHIEVLSKLEKDLPQKINWNPEKDKPTVINIKKDLGNSIVLREKYL